MKYSPVPQWAGRIVALRKKYGLSQQELAVRLGCTAMTISRWEKGTNSPPAEAFGKLANMAHGEKEKLYFAGCAVRIAPGMRETLETVATRHGVIPKHGLDLDAPPGAANIPLYREASTAAESRLPTPDDLDTILSVPRTMVPEPGATKGIYMVGDAMSPLLEHDFIVAFEVTYSDPKRLVGDMVTALTPDGDLTVRWLRKSGRQIMLVAQNPSWRYSPVILSQEPEWQVVGKVLFWIGKPSLPD